MDSNRFESIQIDNRSILMGKSEQLRSYMNECVYRVTPLTIITGLHKHTIMYWRTYTHPTLSLTEYVWWRGGG